MARTPLRVCRAAILVLGPLFALSSAADLVWKVADEGPRAPGSVGIVGDDARVLASGSGGTWELDGTVWRRISLDASASPDGSLAPSFVAGGRFVALKLRSGGIEVFVLRENAWVRLGVVPDAGQDYVPSDDRLYVSTLRFNDCEPDPAGVHDVEGRRLRSISFADGSIREEPPLPARNGRLFVLFGKLHLLEWGGALDGCAAPSSKAGSLAAAAEAPIPFHRLDGDHWTTLEPWPAHGWGFRSSPNSLWGFYSVGPTGIEARVLTAAGLSAPIPDPQGVYDVSYGVRPFEWNGRLLASSREARGNIYELKEGRLERLTPESPVQGERSLAPSVAVAGRRLFTWAQGWDVHAREAETWVPTAGAGETIGADTYFASPTRRFATVGNRVFRRGETGWSRLAPLPTKGSITGAVAVGERAVVAVDDGTDHLFEHDPATDTWRDLKLPEGFGLFDASLWNGLQRSLAATADAVWVNGTGNRLARCRDGVWTIFTPPQAPTPGSSGSVVRVLDGVPHLFGWWGETRPSAWVLRNERLEEAFPGLDPGLRVLDAASAGGRTFLAVRGAYEDGAAAALVSFDGAVFRTLLTLNDLRSANLSPDATAPIAAVGDTAFFAQLAFYGGRLRDLMGPLAPRAIDPSGGFGWDGARRYEGEHPLLVPVPRVRKHLAAVVDSTGLGGTRYRSSLSVANLSPSRSAVARLFPGTAVVPARERTLRPGAQIRIEDPFPGFVGPVTVEFEGLEDESEAWAAVRVWSPSESGTAGTSLVATDPGGVGADGTALRPVRTPGSRLHVAMAATNDGTGAGLWVWDPRSAVPWEESALATVPRGGFLQLDPHPEAVERPLVLAPSPIAGSTGGTDEPMDLLGYLVRNDGATNDGTVVPFAPPDAIPGRRTRFLPAVVGVTSAHAAYRTELTLGSRSTDGRRVPRLEFQASYRDDAVSKTFPVILEAGSTPYAMLFGEVLEVPDAGAWLVANGVPIDPQAFVGTLSFTAERPEGAAALLVTAVVQARAPGAKGDYGVSVPLVSEGRWARERAIVPGLREDGAFRSNLALANPEADGGPEVTLEVTLHAAADGAVIGTLPRMTLAPGRRVQLDRPLGQVGYGGDAWAEVRRVGGEGRFVAYGVMNDAVTSDGTLIPMEGAK